METYILPCTKDNIVKAACLLQNGQVVGMPTETVYGLAANALDTKAVERIFHVKGRPQDNPLIVHIDSMQMLQKVAPKAPKAAYKLAGIFWPGPLTMVLPKGECISNAVSAGLDTVGVRLPAHVCARSLISAAGLPLAAPSANSSGRPSPTTAAHVQQDLGGRLPLILDGGACPVGVESTVLSLVGEPTVLRPGFVTRAELAGALGYEVAYAPGLNAPPAEDFQPQSPGMKYRHYAPNAEITIVDADLDGFVNYLYAEQEAAGMAANGKRIFALCFEGEEARIPVPCLTYGRADDSKSQAHALFGALRALDAAGAAVVYARMSQAGGVGRAVRNRLLRAAAFRVVKP